MQEINAKQEKIQKNPPSKTKEVTTDLRETVSIACKLNSVSVCPMLSQTKLRVGRREWQLAILLRLYLCKALFHMPTHLLLGSWQRSVAEGTYLPFVLLPPFHFSNPSCMDKARKEKKKEKGRHVKFVDPSIPYIETCSDHRKPLQCPEGLRQIM